MIPIPNYDPRIKSALTPHWPPSVLNHETQKLLREVCGGLAPGSAVVEVGAWVGESAMIMAEAENVGHVYSIDTWLGNVELVGLMEKVAFPYEQFLANTQRWRGKISPIRWDAVNGLRWLRANGLDPALVFIDGNHEFEQAWADIHAAARFFPRALIVIDGCGEAGGGERVERAAKSVANEMGRTYERLGWPGMIR